MPKVDEMMVSPVLTVDVSTSVSEAARIMGERHVGSLVVTANSRPVGIFAERDLLTRVIANRLDMNNTIVGDVMSSPLITANEGTRVKDAIALMAQKKIMRLPIVRGNELVGILTGREIFDFISFFLDSLK